MRSHFGQDVNIIFRGHTKDGRPIYEYIDKHTGKKKRLVPSKEAYAAMNKVLREWRVKE